MSQSYVDWLGSTHERPDGSTFTIQTRWAALEIGVEKRLASDAASLVDGERRTMLVYDRRTTEHAEPVHRALQDAGLNVSVHIVEDGHDGIPPSADDERVEALRVALQTSDSQLAVAVGAGTNNDIAKYASTEVNIPYLVYGTAASMNGYNSGIAALYVKGLKSTLPCTPPIGMYSDPEIIAKAPLEMTLAGLGDLCSKPFAGADAAVARLVQGQQPWRKPTEMVEEVFDYVLSIAENIGKGEPEAVASLMEALWISGFSMVLAGSSAPASGGEHLWSHRLDMARHDQGMPIQALHGTQVGVACGLVRPLFTQVADLAAGDVQAKLQGEIPEPNPVEKADEFAAWILERHPDLSEGSRAKVVEEAARKYDHSARSAFRAGLVEHWGAIEEELRIASAHADRVHEALKKSGAPLTPQDMGVEQEESDRILTICRDIRNRQTILDLAADLL